MSTRSTKTIIIIHVLFIGTMLTTNLTTTLFERIKYLALPAVICQINAIYGIMLFIYSAFYLMVKLDQYSQINIGPIACKIIEYEKFTLRLWCIWLFFEFLCFGVCVFTIVSAGKHNATDEKTVFIDGEYKHGSWYCVTEDKHLPNGALISMIDYQYDNNGVIKRRIKYNGEGQIEKYVDYIYNNRGNLIKTEVYKPSVDRQGSEKDYIHDASDRDNVFYRYNNDGMCIFERIANFGLYDEHRYEYSYDNRGRVKRMECIRYDDRREYLKKYSYRFDQKVKKELLYAGKRGFKINLFKKSLIIEFPIITRYIYDNTGNLIKTECKDSTITNYTYDEYNNLIKKEVTVQGRKDYFVEYTYEFFEQSNGE